MDSLNVQKPTTGDGENAANGVNVNATTQEVSYKDGTEPTNDVGKVGKLEVKIEGSLSSVYTKALMEVLNKQTGVNEYQLDNADAPVEQADKKPKKDKKNVSKESQQEINSVDGAANIITNDSGYYKKLDDESIDPSYYYSYIGKNTDINDSESVINTINRIINGYNKKYKENNTVVLERDGEISKSVVMLEGYLNGIGISIHFVSPSDIKMPGISYIANKLGVTV